MRVLPRNLSTKISAAAIIYVLATAILLSAALYGQLYFLADRQQTALGEALTGQLAETLKQPLIDGDVISIQVILDNLVRDTPAVGRSTAYSGANRILAQSQQHSLSSEALLPFIQPITVDNTMLGQIRLELDIAALQRMYRMPLWTTLGLWLVLTVIFAGWLVMTARNYTRRLLRVASFFTASDDTDTEQISELESLEKSLEPFSAGAHDRLAARNPDYSLLVISVPNLPRWRAQLNAEHFNHILLQLDTAIESCVSLYKGIRLHTRSTGVFIQFPNNGEEHPLLRALSCGYALMSLGQSLTATERLPFEMRMATSYCPIAVEGSPWRTDLDREQMIDGLIGILPLANAWELLIDREDIDLAQLPGCLVEELSAEEIWQFKGFTPERETIFTRQLEFISHSL